MDLVQVRGSEVVRISAERLAFRRGLELAAVVLWDEARRRGEDGRWAFEAVKRVVRMARQRDLAGLRDRAGL